MGHLHQTIDAFESKSRKVTSWNNKQSWPQVSWSSLFTLPDFCSSILSIFIKFYKCILYKCIYRSSLDDTIIPFFIKTRKPSNLLLCVNSKNYRGNFSRKNLHQCYATWITFYIQVVIWQIAKTHSVKVQEAMTSIHGCPTYYFYLQYEVHLNCILHTFKMLLEFRGVKKDHRKCEQVKNTMMMTLEENHLIKGIFCD